MYREKGPGLIILYGRRRVGKTALLREFARSHKAIYLLSRQESYRGQLRKMSEEISEHFNDEIIKANPFQSFDALLTYIKQKKANVFFDEFPYLVESNKAIPSILQEHWDNHFSNGESFILLCGSSIRMMESLMGHKSPLYGRRTGQILLEPLKFKDACEFFPNLSKEDKVKFYSILGGTPAYLLEFDYSKSLIRNLKEKVLNKNRFLYHDIQFIIQQELNEPLTYYSIIKSISKGNTKLGNIVNDTGLDKGKITKYLHVLQSLHIIERRIPITEKKNSRKGIYLLKDNYFRFWFRFLFENNDYIDQDRQEKLIKEKIMPNLNSFIGMAYEDIVMEWMQRHFSNYIFGRWWNRNDEIDIVGIDKGVALFCDVKWKDLTQKDVVKIIDRLKEKSKKVTCTSQKYVLFGKHIQNKKNISVANAKFYDLDDL